MEFAKVLCKKDKNTPNAIKKYRMLFTFSCFQKIDKELFRKIKYTISTKVQKKVKILHQITQLEEHSIDIFQIKSECLCIK